MSREMLVIIILAAVAGGRDLVDTTVYGDNSPGPYGIGNSIVDTASLTVSLPDTAAVLPWTYVAQTNQIIFSQPIDSGTPIRVRYMSAFYGVPRMFSLFPKRYLDRNDTAIVDTVPPGLRSLQLKDNLTVSGYKSFGAEIGSFGQVNLEQGLDVRIGGEIGPQTTVTAHLSDQGSSLDGATREISDFDMIYIALDNPSYHVVTGDQYVSWLKSGLLSGEKKIKGLSANFAPRQTPFTFGSFGALSGGQIAVETQNGRTGVQGPYYLHGSGERDFIQPISGTVRIRLGGRQLDEGRDFTVDYSLGTVTFTPRVLVTDEDLIRLEYEYKTFNYQRTMLGAVAGYTPGDSILSVNGVLWSESDSRDHPVDLVLTSAETDSLRGAGDRLPYAPSSRAVHPNDVAGESGLYALYKEETGAGKPSHWVYAPYNTETPDSAHGYHYVWFRKVDNGEKGSYRVQFIDDRGPVYVFAGTDSGDYTDLSPLPAPVRRTSGEIRSSLKLKNLTATLSLAGQDRDRNLFSSRDDGDNQASATSLSVFAGRRQMDSRSFWLGVSHRFTSDLFDAEALSAQDRKISWDDNRLAEQTVRRQQWEASAGATVMPGLETSLLYGQSITASALTTDKASPALRFVRNVLSLDYTGSFFRHFHPDRQGFGRRENTSAKLSFPGHIAGLFYRDEWRIDSVDAGSLARGAGSGLYEGGVSYDFLSLNLHEQISYISKRKNVSGQRSVDTGYSVRFEQSIEHSPLPSWHVRGENRVDHSASYGAVKSRATTLLIDLTSDYSPATSGFSSRQSYRINSEKASAFIQVPVYAGKGMGTHAYDSLRREYVPKTPGDFFMHQQEVYDQGSDGRIRKASGEVLWSYRPQIKITGILNDLSWQGTLACEEHVDAASTEAQSWVPGVLSLGSFISNDYAADPVRYADLSYRQEIEWVSPDSLHLTTGRLMLLPGYQKIRGYRESSVDSRVSLERVIGRATIGSAVGVLSVRHADTGSAAYSYSLLDRRLELTQEYRMLEQVKLSLMETAGFAGKSDERSMYYQIMPAISWEPRGRGTVRAQYTYSYVPFSGEMDYRMARGFQGGTSHQLNLTSDIRMGERFMVIGSLRSDMRRPVGASDFYPANNVFSLEVRAFL